MASFFRERSLYELFRIGVFLKGVNAIAEAVLGLLLFIVSQIGIERIALHLTARELAGDPDDAIANYILHAAHSLSVSALSFAGLYLLAHGVVKLFVVVGLLKDKRWAYPAAIVVFLLFICYQLYRFSHTHSFFLLLLSSFDTVMVWLIWHEYERIIHHEPRT